MTPDTPAVGITHHAAERIVERSELTAGFVQSLLDNSQFFWACDPRPGKPMYALVYDSCMSRHFVAVLAPDSRIVVTLLTLEQFESSCGYQVAPVRLTLARLALLKPEPAPPVEVHIPAAPVQVLWQFKATTQDGVEHMLGTFEHNSICTRFLYVLPPQTQSRFTRRSRRVALSSRFGDWLLCALPPGVDVESVTQLHVEALDPEQHQPLWRTDITESAARGLTLPPNSAELNDLERQAGIAKRKAHLIRKQRKRARKAHRTAQATPVSTAVVLA